MQALFKHNRTIHHFGKTLKTSTCMTAIAIAATAMTTTHAHALPQGASVAHGDVSLAQSGSNLSIHQRTDKAIINWENFDIAKGEATHFLQPNSNSIALNRVVDSTAPSQIFGTLSATGRLVLVNPNGVFFGAGSRVDVGGLIATSADISDENFKAGKLHFDRAGAADAKITNRGTITAKQGGLVSLVAPGVENSGVIRANAGTVALGTGQTVAFDFYGDKLVNFAVKGEADEGITNSGTLSANDGSVYLTADAASKVVDEVVNNTGVIEATSIRKQGNVIILGGEGSVKIGGKVNVSARKTAKKGGNVTITAKKDVKLDNAQIDASGNTGGGSIFVGGSKYGDGSVVSSTTTTVDAGSNLVADALNTGTGGDVILWSERATHFTGRISAKGITGGGFAEVSSRGLLGFYGVVDLNTASGDAGTLLLDPENVTIGADTANDTEVTADGIVNTPDSAGSTFQISASAVETALKNFANVIIEALDTINVNAEIDVSSDVAAKGNSLTLQADKLFLNAAIKLNDGNLTLLGRTIDMSALADLGEGLFRALGVNGVSESDSFILRGTGEIIADGGGAGSLDNAFEVKAAKAVFDGEVDTRGDIQIDASDDVFIRGKMHSGDDLRINAGDEVEISADVTSGPGITDDIIISGTNFVDLKGTGSLASGGDIRIIDSKVIDLEGDVTATDSLVLKANQRLILEGMLSGTVLGTGILAPMEDISSAPIVRVNSNDVSLQTALDITDTGGKLELGATTFTQGGFTLDRAVEISGQGKDQTILDATGFNTGIRINSGGSGTTLRDFTIQNADSNGVQLRDEGKTVSDILIDTMGLKNNGNYGLRSTYETSVDGLTIRDSMIMGNGRDGVNLEVEAGNSLADIRILDNQISDNAGTGVKVTATEEAPLDLLRITGNDFANNGDHIDLSEHITLRRDTGPADTLPEESGEALDQLITDNSFTNLAYAVDAEGNWVPTGTRYKLNGSISSALDAAGAGDTVMVGDGEYEENLVIDKAITLASLNGKDFTTIDGDGGTGILIDGVAGGDVDINGFTIIDTDYGIRATDNNTIGLLNLRNNFFSDYTTNGIRISGTSMIGSNIDHVRIAGSRFEGNITNGRDVARGDITLEHFQNDATFRNLHLFGTTALSKDGTMGANTGIRVTGINYNDYAVDETPAGNLTFDNIRILGDYQTAMIYVADMAGLPSFTMNDVKLGGVSSEHDVAGSSIGQWWGGALYFSNIAGYDDQTISLGNTEFRGVSQAFDHAEDFADAGDPAFEIVIDNSGYGHGFTRILGEGTSFFGSLVGDLTDDQRFDMRRVISDAQVQNSFGLFFVPVARGFVDFGEVKYVANHSGSYPEPGTEFTHSIQNTIDYGAMDGDTVKLESGLWDQGVYINKNITLTGATDNRFDTLLIPTNIDHLPRGFTESFGDNWTARPIIHVNGTNATIQNLSVDGSFLALGGDDCGGPCVGDIGNGNIVTYGRDFYPWERAVGIGFKEAGGTVDNVGVYNIRNGLEDSITAIRGFDDRPPTPEQTLVFEGPRGIGILADGNPTEREEKVYAAQAVNGYDGMISVMRIDARLATRSEKEPRDLEITNSEIAGFEETGIWAHGNRLTVDVNNNTITGGMFFFGPSSETDKVEVIDLRSTDEDSYSDDYAAEKRTPFFFGPITPSQRGIALTGNVSGSVSENLIKNVVSRGSRNIVVGNVGEGFTITDNTLMGGMNDGFFPYGYGYPLDRRISDSEESIERPTHNFDTKGILIGDDVMLSGNEVTGFQYGTDVRDGHAIIMNDTYTDNEIGIRVQETGFATLQDNTISGGDVGLQITGEDAAVLFADKSTGSSFSDYDRFAIEILDDAMDDLDIDGRSIRFNGTLGSALTDGEAEVFDENDDSNVGDVIFGSSVTPSTATPPVPGTPEEPDTGADGDDTGGDGSTDTGTDDTGTGTGDGTGTPPATGTSPDGQAIQALNEFNDNRVSNLYNALLSYFGETLGRGLSFTGNIDLSLFFGNRNASVDFASLSPEQLAGLAPAAGGDSGSGTGLPSGPDGCLNNYLESGHSDDFDPDSCGDE